MNKYFDIKGPLKNVYVDIWLTTYLPFLVYVVIECPPGETNFMILCQLIFYKTVKGKFYQISISYIDFPLYVDLKRFLLTLTGSFIIQIDRAYGPGASQPDGPHPIFAISVAKSEICPPTTCVLHCKLECLRFCQNILT